MKSAIVVALLAWWMNMAELMHQFCIAMFLGFALHRRSITSRYHPEGKFVTAEDVVQDAYLESHPKHAQFHKKKQLFFEDLTKAFGKDCATGNQSETGSDILEDVEERLQGMDPAGQDEDGSDHDVLPSKQVTYEHGKGSSRSKKRKRSGGEGDLYVGAMKEVCLALGDKFGAATVELSKIVSKLAHKSETKAEAAALWGDIRNVEGLTRMEINKAYQMILHDEMLLAAYQEVAQEEKAEWILAIIS